MHWLKIFILCLIFAINVCLPSTSLATDYYVDAVNGDDSNPGTTESPWKTIGKAQTETNEGDVIILRDGNYGALVDTTGDRSDWVIYKSDSGAQPVLTYVDLKASQYRNAYLRFEGITVTPGSGSGASQWVVRAEYTNHLEFINTTLIGDGYGPKEYNAYGLSLKYVSDITIDGCTVRGYVSNPDLYGSNPQHETGFYTGIVGQAGANNVVIKNCDISGHKNGIVIEGQNWTVTNNHVHDIDADGIVIGGYYNPSDNILVANNTIHDLKIPTGASYHNDGLQVNYQPVNNVIIRNNHIYNSYHQGFFINPLDGSNYLIENNLIHDVPWPGVTSHPIQINNINGLTFRNNTIPEGLTYIRSLISVATIVNNIIDKFDVEDGASEIYEDYNILRKWNTNTITCPRGENTLALGTYEAFYSLFADTGEKDYQLKEGSSAIDFGNPDYGPSTDILGNPRDAQPDAGCYEYISGTPDTTVPSVPQNLTATPISESQIDLSWQDSADPESGVSYYKIYRAGSQIDTSVSTSYSNTGLDSGTTYSYEVSAVNGAGLESGRSSLVEAETYSDTTPPAIISVTVQSPVHILFSEPLDEATAETISNYSISPDINISSATLQEDLKTVILITSEHSENLEYTLTVNGVKDLVGNPMIDVTYTYQYNTGLVGHWKFDDGSGSSAADSSGNNNTGTLINGPTWTAGKIDGALSFDGVDDYVQVGAQDVAAPWSASCWVKREDSSNSNSSILESSNYSLKLEQYSNTNKVGFTEYGVADYTFSYEAPIGSWVHLTFVATETETRLYVDGVLMDTTPDSISCPMGQISSATRPVKGIMDEVRIYNRALTADEVLALFNEAGSLVFSPIGDKEVDEGSNLTFDVNTIDPNVVIDINDYNLPSVPSFFSNGGGSWTFGWTPTYDDAGIYEVTFEATYGEFIDSETITITVNNVNRAPEIESINNITGDEGTLITFVVSVSDSDGNDITCYGDNLPAGSIFENYTFEWTPEYDQAGTHIVSFVATDGELEDVEGVIITVNDSNPTSALVPQVAGLAQAAAESAITGVGLTVGTVTNAYSYTVAAGSVISSNPAGGTTVAVGSTVDLVISLGQQTVTVPQVAGLAQAAAESAITGVGLTVGTVTNAYSDTVAAGSVISSNPAGGTTVAVGSAVDLVVSLKKANGPPTLEAIGDKSISENSLLSFSISATDADGDTIVYSAQDLPSGATFTGQTFTWTPSSGQAGIYQVTFVASDGQDTDSETITITVNPEDPGDISDGLVGHWKMNDDAANTTVADSSGYGNDGTAQQNTSVLSTTGKIDSALTFNGSGDYVNCGNDSSLDLTDNFTIAAWIKPTSFARLGGIVGKYHTYPANSYWLRLGSVYPYNKVSFGGKTILNSSSTLNANQWYFIVAMSDSGIGKIYINGNLNASSAVSISSSSDPVCIGADYLGATRYFNGVIDNVMIFNKVLSQAEIDTLYNELPPDLIPPIPDPMTWSTVPYATGDNSIAMQATTASDASGVEYYFDCLTPGGHDSGWQDSPTYEDTGLETNTTYTYQVLARDKSPNQNETVSSDAASATTDSTPPTPTGLVGHWKMDDDAANTTVADSSGYDNDGTAQQNTSVLSTTGKNGSALTFNGSSDYINCGNDSSLDLTDNFTIAAWIKPTSFARLGGIVGKYHTYPANSYWLRLGSVYPYNKVSFGGKTILQSSSTLNANQWYFIVAMSDSGIGKIYINGNLDASSAVSISSSSDPVCIGADYLDAPRYFDGVIDNVMIFNKSLSASEVMDLYNELSLDLIPPIPDPMTWSTVPYATGSTSISMTATTAEDASGVEYYFTCTAGGGHDSGWQDSPTYEDTGLEPNTTYTYQVLARDKSPNQNETVLSGTASATTDSTPPTPSGLVGHWTMDDDAANTTVVDSSGYGNDGTARQNTSVLSTTGKSGSALTFNGSSDYINCGNDSSLDLTDNFTIAAWIKPTSFSWLGGIVGKYHTYPANSYWLRLGSVYPYNKVSFGGKTILNSSSTLNANQWYFIVAMSDSGIGKIYINGNLDASSAVSISSSSDPVCIGADYLDAPRYFDGVIDNVMIFNKVLSQAEIDTLYNGGLGTE